VESVESQKQASTLSTSHLEISPKGGEIFHIPTARAKRSRKVDNQEQVFHFPIALRDYDYCLISPNSAAAFGRSGRRSAPPPAASTNW
jgi:hypothetical protein